MPFWHREDGSAHPEADDTDLRLYTYHQIADIASLAPDHAAYLIAQYEQASTAEEAMRIGMVIEGERAKLICG